MNTVKIWLVVMRLVSHEEKNIKIDWRKEGWGRRSYRRRRNPLRNPIESQLNQDLEKWPGDLQ
jgi:hypothetical protein